MERIFVQAVAITDFHQLAQIHDSHPVRNVTDDG
jgi:hypothetical protein